MHKDDLDKMDLGALMDLPANTPIEDFNRNHWHPLWVRGIELWAEDGEALYVIMEVGFMGWVHRSDLMIYRDLRLAFCDPVEWEQELDEVIKSGY